MKMTDSVLDELYPVPELEELKEEKVKELKEAGFKITNFSAGGVFNMMLMIALRIKIEFLVLVRAILPQMFVSTSSGNWLDLKAADYSKTRKLAQKTAGRITLSADAGHETITIPRSTVFKTEKDINGTELRYFSTEAVTFHSGMEHILVPIEAEMPGADYNVPAGKISISLTHLDGVTDVINTDGWITTAGANDEEDTLLQNRILNAWSEFSTGTTAAKYKSVCEAVAGVLYVTVDQLHPRGQGSVDIIVTSTAGAASEELLEQVRAAAETVRGDYDNLLVKSATTVSQNITILATLPLLTSADGIQLRIAQAVENYFRISTKRNLNELILLDILYTVKQAVPELKNLKILAPDEDVLLETDKVIILGTLEITVEQEA